MTTQGGCSEARGTVTCSLGDLGNNASSTVTIIAKPMVVGSFANTASVTGTEFDPDNANNSATSITTVLLPVAIPGLSAWGLFGLTLLLFGLLYLRLSQGRVKTPV